LLELVGGRLFALLLANDWREGLRAGSRFRFRGDPTNGGSFVLQGRSLTDKELVCLFLTCKPFRQKWIEEGGSRTGWTGLYYIERKDISCFKFASLYPTRRASPLKTPFCASIYRFSSSTYRFVAPAQSKSTRRGPLTG